MSSGAEEPRALPTVSVVIPVLNEEAHLEACLDSVHAQTYPRIAEILVVDGGSSDRTVEIAERTPGVRLLHNPDRIQAAALNIGIEHATGEVIVRVDGHCELAADYVDRAVRALLETGAAMVGGGMSPRGTTPMQRAVAAAMASPIGAGPARFHHSDRPGWVDTVYLGAYWTDLARKVGGYATDVGVNEDAEFAIRMQPHGGVWFEPAIVSTYSPRESIPAVAKQFFRYGRSRSATVRRHPGSLAPRQLVAPALVLGLLSPKRRLVGTAYAAGLLAWGAVGRGERPFLTTAVIPAMHLPWGVGFLLGLVIGPPKVKRRG